MGKSPPWLLGLQNVRAVRVSWASCFVENPPCVIRSHESLPVGLALGLGIHCHSKWREELTIIDRDGGSERRLLVCSSGEIGGISDLIVKSIVCACRVMTYGSNPRTTMGVSRSSRDCAKSTC